MGVRPQALRTNTVPRRVRAGCGSRLPVLRWGGMVGRAGFGGFSPCHAFTLQTKDAAAVGRGKPWESLKGFFAEAGTDTPASATLEGAPGDILRAATSACPCAQGEPVFLHLRHGVISRTWERVRSGRAWIEGALLVQPLSTQPLFDLDRSAETEICLVSLATPLVLLHRQRASGNTDQRKTSLCPATAVPLPCVAHSFLLCPISACAEISSPTFSPSAQPMFCTWLSGDGVMHTRNACTGELMSLVVSGACPVQVSNGSLHGKACACIPISRKDTNTVERLVQISESLM